MKKHSRTAGDSLQISKSLMEAGNITGAMKELKDSLSEFPDNTTILINYAKLAEKTKNSLEAFECYKKAISLKSEPPTWWYVRLAETSIQVAELYLQKGDKKSANEALDIMATNPPDNPNTLFRYARITEQLGQHLDAVEIYGKAILLKKDETPAWWYVRLAQVLLRIGDVQAAINNYEVAVKHQPTQVGWKIALRELKNRKHGNHNTLEASEDYYDELYLKTEKYDLEGDDNVYEEMWRNIANHLKSINATSVIDIGCGPGQFAKFLLGQCNIDYIGIDFSQVAIDMAKKRKINARFYQADALTSEILSDALVDAIICTEVLEHVNEDLKIIERFPKNTYALCSVPSFDAFGHVRTFTNTQAVAERYSKYFREFKIETFTLPTMQFLYLFSGKTK